MSSIIQGIMSVLGFLKSHIFKIPIILLIALASVPFVFPYGDLRSIVATQVSRQMGDGFAIDFTEASLAFGFPFAFHLKDFEFDGPGLPAVAADSLTVKPSLGAIFSRAPEGTFQAEGLFGSTVFTSLSTAGKTKNGIVRHSIEGSIEELALAPLSEALKQAGIIGINLQGKVGSMFTGRIDPSFEEQPIVDIALNGNDVVIPSSQIPITGMPPVETPMVPLSKVALKGKLAEGKLQIEEFNFGDAKDPLNGRIRGEIGVALRKDGPSTRPVFGSMDLKVEINVSKAMMDANLMSGLGMALSFVSKYKADQAGGSKFAFKVKARQVGEMPTFEAL